VDSAAQLTLWPVDSRDHASPSVLPGSERARQTTVTSGLKCCELSQKSGPLGCLERTLLASPLWRSSIANLQWKAKPLLLSRRERFTSEWDTESQMMCWRRSKVLDTPSRRLSFRLAVLMPRTDEIASGLWPTPRAGKTSDESEESWSKRQEAGKVSTPPLTLAVKMWATPNAADAVGSHGGGQGRSLRTDMYNLTHGLWPTPRTNVGTGPGVHGQGGLDLQTAAGGTLNPDWVEWLMGFPLGWSDIGPQSQTSPVSREESLTA
jgi:hypothetical protein